ncbi:MAG: ABC transporter permease subunit [Gammaproteobacteria bacterium]|nr:ABC transporter permease subunit [Gammaproteobacteria bacterium]
MRFRKKKETPVVTTYDGRVICYKPNSWKEDWKSNKILYLLFIPVAAWYIVFHYVPMVGILMAFENYNVRKGLFGSKWVGLDKFIELFTSEQFGLVMRNTVAMALLNLTLGFIAPIILALLVSQVKSKRFQRTAQTVSYMPYFVSAVVITSLASEFLSSTGAVSLFLSWFGFDKQNWLANPNIPVFWLINTFLEIWQGAGWGSIIYFAAIANVNGNLHEAAAIDGATRWQRLWRVTIPTILPLIIMMFTLRIGMVFKTGFDKVLLLYIPKTYDVSDCLTTFTHRMAFGSTVDYGLSTASGLFQSVIGTILLITTNKISRKTAGTSMF